MFHVFIKWRGLDVIPRHEAASFFKTNPYQASGTGVMSYSLFCFEMMNPVSHIPKYQWLEVWSLTLSLRGVRGCKTSGL